MPSIDISAAFIIIHNMKDSIKLQIILILLLQEQVVAVSGLILSIFIFVF